MLPGGSEVAARLHVARAVCRRAEREALEAAEQMEHQPARARLPEPPLRPALHPRPRGELRRRRTALEAWQLLLALVASFVAGYLGSAVGLVLGTLRLPAMLLAAGDRAPPPGRTSRSARPRRRPAAPSRSRRTGRLARRLLDGADLGGRRGHRRADRAPRPDSGRSSPGSRPCSRGTASTCSSRRFVLVRSASAGPLARGACPAS